jgi:DNA repair protein RadC
MAEGHRQRMRERFYNEGIDNFEPHEALEMLLYFSIPRKDTNDLAHKLIDRFGSFHAVLEADRKALLDFGLTENTAALINMVPAFSNYYLQSRSSGTPTLSNLTDIGNLAVMKIGTRKNEVFALMLLDSQSHYINFEIIEHGTVSSTSVSPRKVAESVLRNNAVNVVFVHNHPGGSLQASGEDKLLTQNLAVLLKSIGARLKDHIIVANGRFSSMLELGAI